MKLDAERIQRLLQRAEEDGVEFRYLNRPVELRAAAAGGQMLAGHASVFNTDAVIGPPSNPYWTERVAPGAFRSSILEDDIAALFNHDESLVLGRNTARTLRLSEDAIGLASEIDPPDTSLGRDMIVLVGRTDIRQMSVGMYVLKQLWEELRDGSVRRTIQEAKLYDVSPVTFAAFPTTDIGLKEARSRGLLQRVREQRVDNADMILRSISHAKSQLALAEIGL